MGELDGKVAVVVGAGPGIGRSCALAFAGAGARVVVAARDAKRLDVLAFEIGATPFPVDFADTESCRALIDAVGERFGGIDVLVNVATDGGGDATVDQADWARWRAAFEINVVGTLEVSRSAAWSMAERGGGSIVQISTLGTHAIPPRKAAYTATKLAMVQASMTMAKELGRQGVRVNVVTPGYTTGEPLDRLIEQAAARTGESMSAVSARLAKTAALRRHVDPDDIAEAVLFLSTPRARNITGVELPVTAGQG